MASGLSTADYRIVQEGDRFYPEKWSNSFLKCFSGYVRWTDYDIDGPETDLSFSNFEAAKLFLDQHVAKTSSTKVARESNAV